jgi:hypothetical protein
MIARRLLQTIVFLHYAAWSGAAVLTPPDIPEQALIRTIYEWGDQIAAITEKYQSRENVATAQLYVVDQATSRLVPVRAPGCDTYHDVAYEPGLGKLLLCGSKTSARVYRMSSASWTAESEPMQGTEFRFAVDRGRIAVVSESTVLLLSVAANGRPASIALRIKLPRRELPPSALLLVNDALLIAYDIGEFGGGLYRVDLKRPDRGPTRLIDGNVAALARTKSGVIWAAGGLAHLSGLSAALYRLSGDRLEVIAAISGYAGGRRSDGTLQGDTITEKTGLPFPGLTSLSGLSLAREERPTVVLPTLGVFELARDGFVALYEGDLSFYYRMPPYRVGSDPVGLAIGKSGDFYVASRSLGILVLRKENDRYKLKQLLFEDSTRDKSLNPTR